MPALRIAHISDLHVLELQGTHWTRFLNKRMTGIANLSSVRKDAHPTDIAECLADRLAQPDIDHVIITGDVTNLALDSEFSKALQVVQRIGPPSRVTMIPGNHDMYTRGALRNHRFEKWFSPYLVDDADLHHTAVHNGRLHYPFVRTPAAHVRLYGLSSAIPTPPLLAYGHVGQRQLAKLRELIEQEPAEVTVRIVLVHHNLHHRLGLAEHVASLADRKRFARTMRELHISAVLHGHTHEPHQGHLPAGGAGSVAEKPALTLRSKHGRPEADRTAVVEGRALDAEQMVIGLDIPVLGCGSSTWRKNGDDRARFNILTIGADRLEGVQSLRFDSATRQFTLEHTDLLEKSMHSGHAIRL